jgi:outer membrane protein assembly factor BamB
VYAALDAGAAAGGLMGTLAEIFAPGTIVGDRYRIEGLLGQGGFGAVFRATQLSLDRPVALKAILPDAFGDDGLHRFHREAAIVQRLEHPNIVRLLDFGTSAGGEPFLVFELLEGQTIDQALRSGGPLSAPRVARVASQVLKALMEAHARGIVHRDIKPANVFLCNFQGEPDFVKLLDFGIARSEDTRAVTQRGSVVGTPAYMAPEQVTGAEPTFATDLYALGLTLEEALIGEPVFKDVSLLHIVREHMSPSPVPHAPAALASPLGPVLHRATQKAAERRYPSAREMLAHLDAVVAYALPGAYALPARASGPGPVPDLASAPTAPPVVPDSGGAPLVPAFPAAPPRKKAPPRSRAVFAAGGGAACLVALAAFLTFGKRDPSTTPSTASASTVKAAAPGAPAFVNLLHWRRLDKTVVAELDANGDGRADAVAFCGPVTTRPVVSLCAVDGASLRMLWRAKLGPAGVGSALLAATGKNVVAIDDAGTLHTFDGATGKEGTPASLGTHAVWICAPPEMPGKVWVRTIDAKGLLYDVAARSLADAARPASCELNVVEGYCGYASRLCPPSFDIKTTTFYGNQSATDGGRGISFGNKQGDHELPMLAGFDPHPAGARRPKVLWERPLGSGDGLGAAYLHHYGDHAVAGGRAVAVYDERGETHVVAVDIATGRTLWNEVSASLDAISMTPARVYVERGTELDVRDAATGKLLGTVAAGPDTP